MVSRLSSVGYQGMCLALGNVQDKEHFGDALHIYNKLVFNTPVILTVLYPNAAFRNRRTTETVSITASSDSHPEEFSSTSGLLPSQAAEMAIVPTMHHVRVKPEPCSFFCRTAEMESWIQGAYALTRSQTHLKQEFWRDTRFERLRLFHFWRPVKVGLVMLVQYCCCQFWFHDKILVFFSCLCLTGLCQKLRYCSMLAIIGTMCWHKHTWQLHAAHVWLRESPLCVTLVCVRLSVFWMRNSGK